MCFSLWGFFVRGRRRNNTFYVGVHEHWIWNWKPRNTYSKSYLCLVRTDCFGIHIWNVKHLSTFCFCMYSAWWLAPVSIDCFKFPMTTYNGNFWQEKIKLLYIFKSFDFLEKVNLKDISEYLILYVIAILLFQESSWLVVFDNQTTTKFSSREKKGWWATVLDICTIKHKNKARN